MGTTIDIIVGLIVIWCVYFVVWVIYTDIKHPCIEYWEPYKMIMYIQSWKVAVPHFYETRDCIKRK